MDDSFVSGHKKFIDNMGSTIGVASSDAYIKDVEKAIDVMIESINGKFLQYQNNNIDSIKGFLAEVIHAESFNVNVAAQQGRGISAYVLETNDSITDIILKIRNNDSKFYQIKYYKTGSDTAKAISEMRYYVIGKIVPSDQLEKVREEAYHLYLKNMSTRPEVAESYFDTYTNAKDVILYAKYHSVQFPEKEMKGIVNELKNGTFDPSKHGMVLEDVMKMSYIMNSALKSGATAAIISCLMKLTPELVGLISKFIKDEYVNVNDFKDLGLNCLSTGAQNFIRGTMAAMLTSTFKVGLAGEIAKNINPIIIGTATVVVFNVINRSISMAKGNISVQEYTNECLRDLFVASFACGGAIIFQSFISVPVVGALLGNIVGSIVGTFAFTAYDKLFLSFCAETGYFFFGIVDQNYQLPLNVLKDMGLNLIEADKCEIEECEIDRCEIDECEIDECEVDKIIKYTISRGVIGINRIGYIID